MDGLFEEDPGLCLRKTLDCVWVFWICSDEEHLRCLVGSVLPGGLTYRGRSRLSCAPVSVETAAHMQMHTDSLIIQ